METGNRVQARGPLGSWALGPPGLHLSPGLLFLRVPGLHLSPGLLFLRALTPGLLCKPKPNSGLWAPWLLFLRALTIFMRIFLSKVREGSAEYRRSEPSSMKYTYPSSLVGLLCSTNTTRIFNPCIKMQGIYVLSTHPASSIAVALPPAYSFLKCEKCVYLL